MRYWHYLIDTILLRQINETHNETYSYCNIHLIRTKMHIIFDIIYHDDASGGGGGGSVGNEDGDGDNNKCTLSLNNCSYFIRANHFHLSWKLLFFRNTNTLRHDKWRMHLCSPLRHGKCLWNDQMQMQIQIQIQSPVLSSDFNQI